MNPLFDVDFKKDNNNATKILRTGKNIESLIWKRNGHDFCNLKWQLPRSNFEFIFFSPKTFLSVKKTEKFTQNWQKA